MFWPALCHTAVSVEYIKKDKTYLIACLGELVKVVHKPEYLVVVDLSDGRRVVKEFNLYFRCNWLLLFVVLSSDREWIFYLQKVKSFTSNLPLQAMLSKTSFLPTRFRSAQT